MSSLTANPEDFLPQNQNRLDDGLAVKFFYKPKEDKQASLEAGRPIFKDVVYVDIKIPGERGGGVCKPARQREIDRFPRHYQAFLNRVEAPEEGTPLAEYPLMSRSMVEELAFHNVKTVEQLVGMSDTLVSNFMGLGSIKRKATEWLEETQGADAKVKKLEDELAQLKAQMAELLASNKSEPVEGELTQGQKAAATRKRNKEAKAAAEAAALENNLEE